MQRFVKDQSGMTMGLAVIMIVLLGVMGAGLLTFVSRDLNTVIVENRGQRAFEVADAGIGAAKQQLASGVVRAHYDGLTDIPDIQWSAAQGGLTLDDLDGVGTTPDSVNVTIEYMEAEDEFRVISEGTYGDAKRRIEAIFDGLEAGAGGDGENVGHPLYYTPSSISVDGPNVQMNAISMFAGQDLLIEGVTDVDSFECEYENANKRDDGLDCTNDGTFASFQGKKDSLCDWNSLNPLKGPASPITGCYVNSEGPYNDYGRTITTGPAHKPKVDPFIQPGFAAEGTICGFPDNSATGAIPPGLCGGAASAADGVYGYDSTTEDRGNHREFVAKDCSGLETCPANLSNQISYPFPIFTPIAEGLKEAACAPPGTAEVCTKTPPPVSYFEGIPTDPTWGLDTNEASDDRIAFIDAQNQTLTWNPGGGSYKGIIVVWCGRMEMAAPFQGIIINIMGDELPGNTSCDADTPTVSGGVPDGHTVATYENLGHTCACWVYAEGGTASQAGIQIDANSTLTFRPSETWSFENGLFEGPPPTNFAIKNWRELYE